jgi:hypothetical protein
MCNKTNKGKETETEIFMCICCSCLVAVVTIILTVLCLKHGRFSCHYFIPPEHDKNEQRILLAHTFCHIIIFISCCCSIIDYLHCLVICFSLSPCPSFRSTSSLSTFLAIVYSLIGFVFLFCFFPFPFYRSNSGKSKSVAIKMTISILTTKY